MSQASVVAALGSWFGGALQTDPDGGQRKYTGGPIAGLGTVYTGFIVHFPASDFWVGQQPGAMSGAIAIIDAREPHEERASYGGPGAWWRVAHPIVFHLYHLSKHAHAEDALTDLRAMQDAIRARLRTDTTLGGKVFSCGEHDPSPGGATGSGHKWKSTTPATSGGRTETRSDWQLTVIEYTQ